MLNLRPSNSDQWMRCFGSAILAQHVPPQADSPYAAEGRRLHAMAATQLIGGPSSPTLGGDERIIKTYTGIVRSYMRPNTKLYVEKTLAIEQMFPKYPSQTVPRRPLYRGSSDAVLVHSNDDIDVFDLKTGQGIMVQPDSWQGVSYALGALTLLDHPASIGVNPDITVRFHIVQPTDADGEGHRIQTYTLEQLLTCSLRMSTRIEQLRVRQLMDPSRVDTNPGEKQCRFCPAAIICNDVHNDIAEKARANIDPTQFNDKAGALARYIQEVYTPWSRNVMATINDRLHHGAKIPGTKLVERRPRRYWVDEAQAAQILEVVLGEDKAYTRKLISVAQAEKEIPIDESLWIKKSSGLDVALESDPRPPVDLADNPITNDLLGAKK